MPVVTRPRKGGIEVQGKIDFPCRKTRSRSAVSKKIPSSNESNIKANCRKKQTERPTKKNQEIVDRDVPEINEERDMNWLDDLLTSVTSPQKRQHDNKDNLEDVTKQGLSPPKIKKTSVQTTSRPLPCPINTHSTSPMKEYPCPQSPRLSLRKLEFETIGHLNSNENNLPSAISNAKHLVASPRKSPRKENIVPKIVSPKKGIGKIDFDKTPNGKVKNLFRNDGECYMKVKKALHTSVPDRLLCRDKETSQIMSFLQAHIGKKKPGSLYISGAPGTGKTACLSHIIKLEKELINQCKVIFLNCMTLKYSHAIFSKLASELGVEITNKKDASRQLEREFTRKGRMILMVLDEIDYLDSKNQEVLYTMFEWPSLSKSRAVLIGIANALDLTDRILPRLQARVNCRPAVLNFVPYSKDQIVTILADRLKETDSSEEVFEGAAIQFCARKVSSVAGDIRKALDVCRRAVDVVSADVRSQTLLKPGKPGSKSPKKPSIPASVTKKVGLIHISNVISDAYDSCLSRNSAEHHAFPLQQKLAVCTLLLLVKHSKMKDVTLGKLHETYSKVCKSRHVPPVDQSEFLSLCHLIETRGIIGLKKSKETRLTKICLKLAEKEVEFALQDKVLLSSILSAGLPSKK
ncbi:cell division control protein 6 homolog [Anneissia japonica]|uniref:cell division control protein 6 homolog n=1 Tax=Anneissia japonica TaxID=1529436 RepID=UPI0014257C91|nr:cell division control protein 6 homolog [Anneissia japonica]